VLPPDAMEAFASCFRDIVRLSDKSVWIQHRVACVSSNIDEVAVFFLLKVSEFSKMWISYAIWAYGCANCKVDVCRHGCVHGESLVKSTSGYSRAHAGVRPCFHHRRRRTHLNFRFERNCLFSLNLSEFWFCWLKAILVGKKNVWNLVSYHLWPSYVVKNTVKFSLELNSQSNRCAWEYLHSFLRQLQTGPRCSMLFASQHKISLHRSQFNGVFSFFWSKQS
jgi:hypothetical protein